MSEIIALLFDTDGVLYHRPRQNRHLRAFLDQQGLALRPRSVLDRALKAAYFDVRTGRISVDEFYDAILRVNGVTHPALLADGREALARDDADIELFPGVRDTLTVLEGAGYFLGTLTETPHPVGRKIAWLAARGVSPGLWTAFVVSPDAGLMAADPTFFHLALYQLDAAPYETIYVGHDPNELVYAADVGLWTIAFLPDDPAVETDYIIGSFYELADMLVE
jgi:FMN phosphatase YigB (HAD superfamily)